jgi:hypothetical protein
MAETKKKKTEPAAKSAEAPAAKSTKARSEAAGAQAKSAKASETAETSQVTTKFATFVRSQKLDPRRILIASRKLETLRPEDRAIKLGKRKARATEGGDGAAKETRKPRSGRPVTHRALQAALTGGQLSGPTKTRILRAVNHLLDQKKQAPVDLRALF